MRSLILDDRAWRHIWPGFLIIAVAGAIMLVLNLRVIRRYD